MTEANRRRVTALLSADTDLQVAAYLPTVENGHIYELADTLDEAIGAYLENARYPSRKVNEIDNRGSTYYLALAWAQALAAQDEDAELQQRFAPVAARASIGSLVRRWQLPQEAGCHGIVPATTTNRRHRHSQSGSRHFPQHF